MRLRDYEVSHGRRPHVNHRGFTCDALSYQNQKEKMY